MRTEPTREQLQMAYRHYADHHWPPTLDDALRRPAFAKIITSLAGRLNRPAWRSAPQVVHSLPCVPAPPTPDIERNGNARPIGSIARGPATAFGSWPTAQQRSLHSQTRRRGADDCKKAAANDRDDHT